MSARDELVQANLLFVVDVAKQYQDRGLSFSDLISSGNLGLITAAERFDGTKGFKFISYAVWWIRQAILQALAEQARIVRLPRNKIALLKRIHKAAGDLREGQDYEPTAEEIAAALDESVDEVRETLDSARSIRSLDAEFGTGGDDDRSLYNLVPGATADSVEESLLRWSTSQQVEDALAVLDERKRRIVQMYFGLDGQGPMTLEEIGGQMGITREWVRQLKELALHKLRHPSRIDALRGLDEEGSAQPKKERSAALLERLRRREQVTTEVSEALGRQISVVDLDRLLGLYAEQVDSDAAAMFTEYLQGATWDDIHARHGRFFKNVQWSVLRWLCEKGRLEDLGISESEAKDDEQEAEPEAPRVRTKPVLTVLARGASVKHRITPAMVQEYMGFVAQGLDTGDDMVNCLVFGEDESIEQGKEALRLAAREMGRRIVTRRLRKESNVLRFFL